MWWYLLWVFLFCVVMGLLTSNLAKKKGYEGYSWMGFILGVIGLIYVAGLPDKRILSAIYALMPMNITSQSGVPSARGDGESDTKEHTKQSSMPFTSSHVICPNCNEIQSNRFDYCKHCGEKLK